MSDTSRFEAGKTATPEVIGAMIGAIYRSESRRVLATLVRLLGDFDLAEDALQEAFASAASQWPRDGVPNNPRAWLVSAGRFRSLDRTRRRAKLGELEPELLARFESIARRNADAAANDIEDDRLRLIFTCCHPAIDPKVRVPLTLREVCGLATEEIASAFLTSAPTMAQRIARGKAKIRDAGIPFVVPTAEDLPQRLEAVLAVVYLIFNEGYSASRGESATRVDLSDEAIRLARLLVELLPEPEAIGLLGLMLLHESRRAARLSATGDLVLLDEQDRSLWDAALIAEGRELVERSFASGRVGPYTLQAAISAVHAEARSAPETDWPRIGALYDALLLLAPSPVVELNRAVAVAMRDGPEAGLTLVDELLERNELTSYHLAHAARGELLRRLDQIEEAVDAFELALELARQEPERRFLEAKIKALRSSPA